MGKSLFVALSFFCVSMGAQAQVVGRGARDAAVGGPDIRIILGRIIPDFDRYFQELIDQIDQLIVTSDKGETSMDVWLAAKELIYPIKQRKHVRAGHPYAVRLSRHTRLKVYMRGSRLVVDGIRGITLFVRLPLVPDAIRPLRLELDTDNEILGIYAKAAASSVTLVATADLHDREYKGIDWCRTLEANLPFHRSPRRDANY